jgi:hypothetical protein
MDAFRCSICQRIVMEQYGNNAHPVNDGKCCDECDWLVVIPARIRLVKERMGRTYNEKVGGSSHQNGE